MSSILDTIMQQIQGGGGIQQMSRSLGLGEDDVGKVVSGAIPALMGSLTRNSGSSDGAAALLSALDRDHDGSILDDVAGFLGQSGSADAGAGILRHALGGKQATVESALSRSTGVDSAAAGKILAMVAPIVMGALGKAKRQQGLDAGGLSGLLRQEEQVARQRSPQAIDMVSRVLDSDGDGSVMDDVAKMGSSLLGSLFKK